MNEDRGNPEVKEASETLEEAIKNWYRTTYGEDQMVVGWLLITDLIALNGQPGDGYVATTSSDNLTVTHQLGLMDYTRINIANQIGRDNDHD